MSWLARIRRRPETAGSADLVVGDPRYDDWEVVREFEDVETGRAWLQHLSEVGVPAALTSDHSPDRFGRGEIWLQVPAGRWSEAEEFLSELE